MNTKLAALVAAASMLLACAPCSAMGETSDRVDLSTAVHLASRGDAGQEAVIVESMRAIVRNMDDAGVSADPAWEIAALAVDGWDD